MPEWKKLEDDNFIKVPNARRIKLMADEDIEDEVVEYIKSAGVNIVSIKERGLAGFPDTAIEARARKEKRFLLTKNSRDFLNDRKFPINKIFGIIVIEGSMRNTQDYAKTIGRMVAFIIPHEWGYTKCKVSLTANTMSVKGRDYTGKNFNARYKFVGRDWYFWGGQ